MKDGLEVEFLRPELEPHNFQHHFYAETTLMSIGPEGRTWLNENCPEWRDHVSMIRVKSSASVAEEVLVQGGPAEYTRMMKWLVTGLASELAKHIIDRAEPLITESGRKL